MDKILRKCGFMNYFQNMLKGFEVTKTFFLVTLILLSLSLIKDTLPEISVSEYVALLIILWSLIVFVITPLAGYLLRRN